MSLARAELETLLRTRRLDHTLTTTLPGASREQRFEEDAIGPTGLAALDASLAGGFPRGQLSEIIGSRSSGRTSLLLHMIAAATARGELVALVDVLDMFDVESAAAAGVPLERLLWIRGHVLMNPGFCRDLNQRAMEQAIRALGLVLSSGHFGLVVFDAAEAPVEAVRRLPFTTWVRIQRMLEGRPTICVLAGLEQMARSAAGLTVRLRQGGLERLEKREGRLRACETEDEAGGWKAAGARFRSRLFDGLDVEARLVRARARACTDTIVALQTRTRDDG